MNDKRAILQSFGARVRKYRNSLRVSQEELAHRAGFHRTYIGMLERGEKNISLSNLIKLSTALEIQPRELLPDGKEEHSQAT